MLEIQQVEGDIPLPERQALEWVELIVMGELSPDHARALMRWRAQSPVNEAAFRRATELKYLLDRTPKPPSKRSFLARISYEILRFRAPWSRQSRGNLC